MIPLFVMLLLATTVSAMIAARHRIKWLYAISVISGLAATYVAVTMINDSSSSAAVGHYAYYVNGVRISQGFAVLTENIGLFLILGLFIVLCPLRLGTFLGEKVSNVNSSGKPMVWSLIIWILCIAAGGWVLSGAISSMNHPIMLRRNGSTVYIIICVISSLVTLAGLCGVLQFIIAVRKRK